MPSARRYRLPCREHVSFDTPYGPFASLSSLASGLCPGSVLLLLLLTVPLGHPLCAQDWFHLETNHGDADRIRIAVADFKKMPVVDPNGARL